MKLSAKFFEGMAQSLDLFGGITPVRSKRSVTANESVASDIRGLIADFRATKAKFPKQKPRTVLVPVLIERADMEGIIIAIVDSKESVLGTGKVRIVQADDYYTTPPTRREVRLRVVDINSPFKGEGVGKGSQEREEAHVLRVADDSELLKK